MSKTKTDFDWEALFKHLGELDSENFPQTSAHDAAKMTAAAMKMFDDWLMKLPDQPDPRTLKAIGTRAVAMQWVIDPKRFGGVSLATLAKSLGFKGANAMSPHAAEFSRLFKIQNRFQSHDWRKK